MCWPNIEATYIAQRSDLTYSTKLHFLTVKMFIILPILLANSSRLTLKCLAIMSSTECMGGLMVTIMWLHDLQVRTGVWEVKGVWNLVWFFSLAIKLRGSPLSFHTIPFHLLPLFATNKQNKRIATSKWLHYGSWILNYAEADEHPLQSWLVTDLIFSVYYS